MKNLSSIIDQHWDVIVIGTGMGGGTIGYELARKGQRVLFVEKGRSYLTPRKDKIDGRYVESCFGSCGEKKRTRKNILRRAGRCTTDFHDHSNAKPYAFMPAIGEGSGGSSALYGMVLERFFPKDFQAPASSSDSPTWPIQYEDLRPFYKQAERLYRVKGTLDPLRAKDLDPLSAPPPFSPPSQELNDELTRKGFHPYALPMACEYVAQCKECIGFICPKKCKNDSVNTCVAPAIQTYGATLLDECEVTRLISNRKKVQRVNCKHHGLTFSLKADMVVLAAGALQSPAILLRSASPQWPRGLANTSGLVGRNLMRHYMDLYCIKTKAKRSATDLIKQIAFNDAYYWQGHTLGTVQAVGKIPSTPALIKELCEEMERKGHPLLARFFNFIRPLFHFLAERLVSRRIILTGIMEDLPNDKNRVTLSESGKDIKIEYTINPVNRQRIQAFRKRVKHILKSFPVTFIPNAENNERLAHVCGTCRFGINPESSVLDENNLAHGIENLYVVDASFFPTSSGMNPALTIAANALRVAGHIHVSLEKNKVESISRRERFPDDVHQPFTQTPSAV